MTLPEGHLLYLHQQGRVLIWSDIMAYVPCREDSFVDRMQDHLAAETFARATQNESIINREVLAQIALTAAIDELIDWRHRHQPNNVINVDFTGRRRALPC